ncbi:hypothetical protein HYW87_03810 [Candidatus Roizmanbacteria bacterium]|nr:hypothetical protein [Candidatus Roizmanbacteria bacterium]
MGVRFPPPLLDLSFQKLMVERQKNFQQSFPLFEKLGLSKRRKKPVYADLKWRSSVPPAHAPHFQSSPDEIMEIKINGRIVTFEVEDPNGKRHTFDYEYSDLDGLKLTIPEAIRSKIQRRPRR